jgi:hypothetical protein
MLVVYWGRWADATGNVGPWSNTVVGRVEGWSDRMLLSASVSSTKPAQICEDPFPALRVEKYSVAVRDAQYEYLNAPGAKVPTAPPLLAPAEGERTRRLEGPLPSDAEEAKEAA